MRERAGFCRSSGIGAVRQMIYRSAGTSERRQRKSAHRLAQLAGITAGHRRGTKLRMVQLAGIAAVATAAFTSNAAAQSASIRIVSGNERFAVEAGLQAQNSSRPIVFEIDLPPTSELPFGTKPLRVTLTNAASFQNHSESAARVRNTNGSIGLRFTVSGDCINQGSKGFLGNMAAWITFSPKSNCDAHTVRATYDGLNYTKDQTGGRFYITLFQQDRPGRNSPFLADSRRKTGARFDIDAYIVREPLTVSATESFHQVDSSGELINKTLFTFSANHEVDTEARLSLDDPSIKASYDDINYNVSVDGDLGFLAPDAQGNARRLVLQRGGTTIATLQPDSSSGIPRATTGPLILWSLETAGKQTFTVAVEGESETPYAGGALFLAVTSRLSNPVGLFDADFGNKIVATTIGASGYAARFVSGNDVYARESSFDRVDEDGVEIDIDLPAIKSDGNNPLRILFAVSNDPVFGNHSTSAARVQLAGSPRLSGTGCENQTIGSNDAMSGTGSTSNAGPEVRVFISDCPAQTLRLKIPGIDYNRDQTNGRLYLRIAREDASGNPLVIAAFELQAARFDGVGYSLSETVPLSIVAVEDPKPVATPTTFADNALFRISGDVLVDEALRLSIEDESARPAISDIKYFINLSGDFSFLAPDAQGNTRRLTVTSNVAGATPVVLTQNASSPRVYEATLSKSAEEGEVFTIAVEGTSSVPYINNDTRAEVVLRVQGPSSNSFTLLTASEIFGNVLSDFAYAKITGGVDQAPHFAVRVVSGNEIFAGEAGLKASATKLPIEIEVDVPLTTVTEDNPNNFVLGRIGLDNDPREHSITAARVQANGGNGTQMAADCADSGSANPSVPEGGTPGWSFFISDCPAHTRLLTYDSLDYSKDETGGRLYLKIGHNASEQAPNGIREVIELYGASFEGDAYAFTSPFALAPTEDMKGLLGSGELGNTRLFRFSSDVAVDEMQRLSLTDETLRPAIVDVKYDVVVEGNLGFLVADAQEQGRSLMLISEANGMSGVTLTLDDASNPTRASGRIAASIEGTETFAIDVSGGSSTPYADGEIRVTVTPVLERTGVPLSDTAFSTQAALTAKTEILRSIEVFERGMARFVMPWVYEGEALAGQGDQMVTTSMQLSNLTNKTIGPVRVEVADSSVAGISVDAPAMLFETIAPYTSVEITGTMLTDALPDFGQATLVLTVDGATPQDLTLRRFTDVGGDLYTDNFGTAESFNEFNPTP